MSQSVDPHVGKKIQNQHVGGKMWQRTMICFGDLRSLLEHDDFLKEGRVELGPMLGFQACQEQLVCCFLVLVPRQLDSKNPVFPRIGTHMLETKHNTNTLEAKCS